MGRGLGRPFFLLRLRASADFNFAFCPGGIKNACFFASLMISSVMTFRLNRRKALSIDSPGLIVTTAIYISTKRFVLSTEPLIKHVRPRRGQADKKRPCECCEPIRRAASLWQKSNGSYHRFLLPFQALDLDRLVAVISLKRLLLENHLLIE